MRQLKYIILFTCSLCFFSCKTNNKKTEKHILSLNNTREIDELKTLILTKGDTVAYDELHIALLTEKFNEEYLLYSLIMANRYKYPHAYYGVYKCLTSAFEQYDKEIDAKTLGMALSYLEEGVDLNDGNATKELADLYLQGKYIMRDTVMGKMLQVKGHQLCGF